MAPLEKSRSEEYDTLLIGHIIDIPLAIPNNLHDQESETLKTTWKTKLKIGISANLGKWPGIYRMHSETR